MLHFRVKKQILNKIFRIIYEDFHAMKKIMEDGSFFLKK